MMYKKVKKLSKALSSMGLKKESLLVVKLAARKVPDLATRVSWFAWPQHAEKKRLMVWSDPFGSLDGYYTITIPENTSVVNIENDLKVSEAFEHLLATHDDLSSLANILSGRYHDYWAPRPEGDWYGRTEEETEELVRKWVDRILKVFAGKNIIWLSELSRYTEHDLLKFRNFGRKSLNLVKLLLKEFPEFDLSSAPSYQLSFHELAWDNDNPNIYMNILRNEAVDLSKSWGKTQPELLSIHGSLEAAQIAAFNDAFSKIYFSPGWGESKKVEGPGGKVSYRITDLSELAPSMQIAIDKSGGLDEVMRAEKSDVRKEVFDTLGFSIDEIRDEYPDASYRLWFADEHIEIYGPDKDLLADYEVSYEDLTPEDFRKRYISPGYTPDEDPFG